MIPTISFKFLESTETLVIFSAEVTYKKIIQYKTSLDNN